MEHMLLFSKKHQSASVPHEKLYAKYGGKHGILCTASTFAQRVYKYMQRMPCLPPYSFPYICVHVIWMFIHVNQWRGGRGGRGKGGGGAIAPPPPQRALKRGRQNDYDYRGGGGGASRQANRVYYLEDCTDVTRKVCCLHVVT